MGCWPWPAMETIPMRCPSAMSIPTESSISTAPSPATKLDAIGRCPKASFCVVDQDQVEPLAYTTHYRSVIAFGTIRVLEDDREKQAAIEALAVKYAPEDSVEHRERYIQQDWASVCLLEMAIDHLSGKEERELARERRWEQGVDCAGC